MPFEGLKEINPTPELRVPNAFNPYNVQAREKVQSNQVDKVKRYKGTSLLPT